MAKTTFYLWHVSCKLFVEGFAQWTDFRMMDYFGLNTNMKQITLRGVDSNNPDEYGIGFRICKYIENEYGFYNLIEFIRRGYISIDGEELTVEQLIKNSNLETYL